MKIAILGCGRWGTFLAYYLHRINHEVLLWGRDTSEKMKRLSNNRKNDYLTLPQDIILSTSLKEAFNFSQFVVIATNPHSLQNLIDSILAENYKNKTFIIAMKGFVETGERISSVLMKSFSDNIKIVSLTGAGQPQDLIRGIPTCMLVDSRDDIAKREIAQLFESELISVHIGNDLIGSEIGSAAKNVLGIGSGILEALGFRPLIGSLVVFGLNELSELISKAGGKKETIYGLSCLGDMEATFFSSHSRSRNAGFSIVNSLVIDHFIPGFYTAETILKIAEKHKVLMPLFSTINQIIKKQIIPNELINCVIQYKKNLRFNSSQKITKVYYCRAVDGFPYEYIRKKYNEIDAICKSNNLLLLNNDKAFLPYSIIDKQTSLSIVENNMKLLEEADCVIVDLSFKNHLYVGCIDEMVCANQKGIFVIVICGDSGVEKHFYTNYRADKIVKSFDDAISYINTLNRNMITYEN